MHESHLAKRADANRPIHVHMRWMTAHLSRAVAGTASTIAQMIATLSVTEA